MVKGKPFYLKPWFWALIVIIIIGLWFIGTYNSFIVLTQDIDKQWGQVETQYQRRVDLIPNLVSSATGYMQFERSLLEELTSLRSQWTSATTAEEKVEAANALDSAIGRLLMVVENYPELKSIQAVLDLMDEIAGTENRIAVERSRFNNMVRNYNIGIKMFPSNMLANMFGFTERSYFQAEEGAEEAPEVNLTVT